MDLFEIIRDFFVKYVFGGYDSNGNLYSTVLGFDSDLNPMGIGDIYYRVGSFYDGSDTNPMYLNIGDYLSLIATIITMVVILLFCIFIIKKIIGVMFRLFTFGA